MSACRYKDQFLHRKDPSTGWDEHWQKLTVLLASTVSFFGGSLLGTLVVGGVGSPSPGGSSGWICDEGIISRADDESPPSGMVLLQRLSL